MDFTKENVLDEIKAKAVEINAATDLPLGVKKKALETIASLHALAVRIVPALEEMDKLEKVANKLREKCPKLKKYI